MAWLDDHPPARDQFRCPRRERPSGVMVVHTAENTPDFVAFDGGAEAVANFIRGRSGPGSYHDLADSDSCINLVAYTCEAYQDGTGSNPHAWGGSVATRADAWAMAPRQWRDGAVAQLAAAAARYARWVKATHGVTVPARRINRAQSEARMPGFISHAERDPARRSDPGAAFPWDQFLNEYARAMGQSPEDDMPLTATDINEIKTAVRLVLNEGTAAGQRSWAETSHATLANGQHNTNLINALAGAVGRLDQVDEQALAEALAPLLQAQIPVLSDADLAAVAVAVADEQHRRSAA